MIGTNRKGIKADKGFLRLSSIAITSGGARGFHGGGLQYTSTVLHSKLLL